MIQKRGISPLIATILLIGFTVVLAGIIFTWGQGWFTGLTESTEESTSLQLACINKGRLSITEVCNNTDTTTKVTIINTGSEPYTSCNIVGGGESAPCKEDLAIGGINSTILGVLVSAGKTVSSTFTINVAGIGTATCQGASYTIPSGGVKSC